jgi:hypothetical protein
MATDAKKLSGNILRRHLSTLMANAKIRSSNGLNFGFLSDKCKEKMTATIGRAKFQEVAMTGSKSADSNSAVKSFLSKTQTSAPPPSLTSLPGNFLKYRLLIKSMYDLPFIK